MIYRSENEISKKSVIRYFFAISNLFPASCLNPIALENINNMKNDLNNALGLASNNDVFIITIVRQCHVNAPSTLPMITHSELRLVLQLLYAMCGLNSPEYTGAAIGANPDDPPLELGNFQDPSTKILFKQRGDVATLASQLTSLNMRNHCKLIVLNEMFFSQRNPLSPTQFNFIKSKIEALSNASQNTIVYANFLHTVNKSVTGKDIHQDYAKMDAKKTREK